MKSTTILESVFLEKWLDEVGSENILWYIGKDKGNKVVVTEGGLLLPFCTAVLQRGTREYECDMMGIL